MQWIYGFGVLETTWVVAYVLFYSFYAIKTIRIAQALEVSFSRIIYKFILRTCFFGLALVALMGPTFGDNKVEVQSKGKDIMICVDLSQSMNAFDIQPTRLERIKFEMNHIISSFRSDQIGIIIFSSEAFMQSPLTYDQNALHLFIKTIHTGLVPSSGTNFAAPLHMALKKLTSIKDSHNQEKSKIIVLISDGEDFGENTEDVVDDIKKSGITLYTLGVGTNKGSKLRSGAGFKSDREGNTVISRLNAQPLKALANATGGEYFEINNEKSDINKLIDNINKVEGTLRSVQYIDASNNEYHPFLLAALILLAIDIAVSLRVIKI